MVTTQVVFHASRLRAALLCLLAVAAGPALSADLDEARLARQAGEYAAEIPKTIVELQRFRDSETVVAKGPRGRDVRATLINLNPRINAWYVLSLDWGDGRGPVAYHLENPRPDEQTIHLARSGDGAPTLEFGAATRSCTLWSPEDANADEAARQAQRPFAPVCNDRLYLRNRAYGARTRLERATDLLRDHVPGGEIIIGLVKQVHRDAEFDAGAPRQDAVHAEPSPTDGPRPARTAALDRPVVPVQLGIDVGRPAQSLVPGTWYAAHDLEGVHVSYLVPRLIAPEILRSNADRVSPLEPIELDALAYLISFDLGAFELGFALGTDHPRVGWSDRPAPPLRSARLPGPDGIATIAPLVSTGMVSPALTARTVATFTGGFKRQHGAFRYGPLAERNLGSHYGFIEHGTVFSKLQPGLATLYVLDDGSIGMTTWTREDDALLPRMRHARQNGVPLIEPDGSTGTPIPGAMVNRWGPGNWSGSADEKLRSVRSGACLQEDGARRFLIYGYFSAATPSAMARVFQAYGCRYAIHLDMNALEHTYLAVYKRRDAALTMEHLVRGMEAIDTRTETGVRARFLQVPDDRDFFYVVRRERKPS